VPLPEAYRSLLRPSSPDEAKASTDCCNWFMQTLNILGVYLTHLHFSNLPNFQRTKVIWVPGGSVRGIRREMVGPDGLEPSTPRLSSACSNQLSYEPKFTWGQSFGGAGRVRTDDPLLAKQVLYQLSYDPKNGLKERFTLKFTLCDQSGPRRQRVSPPLPSTIGVTN
jgi:hypothetical protein